MADQNQDKWYFTKEVLGSTPSRACNIDAEKELGYRQQATNFIQDMGQRLQVTQLCINTGIVYMHRFYMFHSFSRFHRNAMATASLFLAAKVEEQPRKLDHVIKISQLCLREPLEPSSDQFQLKMQEVVVNENILLQTLGFELQIDHPHTHIVKCCQLVRASKDLAQTAYFMATNSLHLTTLCLELKPTVVACICINLACKWTMWEIPISSEGKEWYWYVDKTIQPAELEALTADFVNVYSKCPSRLKKKIMSMGGPSQNSSSSDPSYHDIPETVHRKLMAEMSAHKDSKDSSEHKSSRSHHDESSRSKAVPSTSTSAPKGDKVVHPPPVPVVKDVLSEILDKPERTDRPPLFNQPRHDKYAAESKGIKEMQEFQSKIKSMTESNDRSNREHLFAPSTQRRFGSERDHRHASSTASSTLSHESRRNEESQSLFKSQSFPTDKHSYPPVKPKIPEPPVKPKIPDPPVKPKIPEPHRRDEVKPNPHHKLPIVPDPSLSDRHASKMKPKLPVSEASTSQHDKPLLHRPPTTMKPVHHNDMQKQFEQRQKHERTENLTLPSLPISAVKTEESKVSEHPKHLSSQSLRNGTVKHASEVKDIPNERFRTGNISVKDEDYDDFNKHWMGHSPVKSLGTSVGEILKSVTNPPPALLKPIDDPVTVKQTPQVVTRAEESVQRGVKRPYSTLETETEVRPKIVIRPVPVPDTKPAIPTVTIPVISQQPADDASRNSSSKKKKKEKHKHKEKKHKHKERKHKHKDNSSDDGDANSKSTVDSAPANLKLTLSIPRKKLKTYQGDEV